MTVTTLVTVVIVVVIHKNAASYIAGYSSVRIQEGVTRDDHFFVYPTKLREYQARYRGSFQHGGVTPEEVIVPVALLTPRGSR